MLTIFRWITGAVLIALAACTAVPEAPQEASMGDFRLGFNVVVVRDALQGPGSQVVDEAALQAALERAVIDRLGAYDGDGLYHMGIRVDAYVLGEPGSGSDAVLLMAANVWDEATKRNLTAPPLEITGTVPSRNASLSTLADSAARALEEALRENADVWFAPKPNQPRVVFDRAAQQPSAPVSPN